MVSVLAFVAHEGRSVIRSIHHAMSLPAFSPFQHVEGAAAEIPGGRILIVGSCMRDASKNAELFDPASNSWQPCPQMAGPRKFGPFAVAMPDGRVVVAGGSRDVGDSVLDIEAFDPRQQAWSVVGRLPDGARVSDLAPLRDGRLLISTEEGEASGLLCFDPVSGKCSEVGNPAMVVNGSARLTLLKDGKALVTHLSYGDLDAAHSNAFLFDPQTDRTSMLPAMRQSRQNHEATLMGDGRVLVSGGTDGGEPSAEIYDPAQGHFLAAGPMVAPRALHAAVALRDGRVLIIGGIESTPLSAIPTALLDPDRASRMTPEEFRKAMPKPGELKAEVECYDPASNTFAPMPDPPSHIQTEHGALHELEPDGRVLFMSSNGPLYFDPATRAWQFPQPEERKAR